MVEKSLKSNTVSLILMQAVTMTIMFFVTVAIARTLGDGLFGLYSFAVAFTGLTGVIAHFGLEFYLTRQIARDKKLEKNLLSNALGLKIPLAATMILITIGYLTLLKYDLKTVNTVFIFALYTILISYGKIFRAIYQSHNRMDLEAIAEVTARLFLLITVIYALLNSPTIYTIAYAFLAFSLFDFLFSAILCKKYFNLPKPNINFRQWKSLWVGATPFFLTAALLMITFKIDIIMLSIWKPDYVVGWYGAAFKIIEGLLVIPTAIVVAAYPVLSKSYKENKLEFKQNFKTILKILALLGIALSLATLSLAEQIIFLVFGENFIEAVPALKMLSMVALVMYVRYLMSISLNATDNEHWNLKIAATTTFANIILNLVYIPTQGHIGAAKATLATELIYLILAGYVMWNTLKKIKT